MFARAAFSTPRTLTAALVRQVREKGHSKWQNIKATKTKNDAKSALVSLRYCRLIIVAVKENGPDPKRNKKLADTIEEALANSVRRSAIEHAIKSVDKSKEDCKEFLVEVVGPGGSHLLIEAVASKRSAIDPPLNNMLKRKGGMQQRGLANNFDKTGIIAIQPGDKSIDKIWELAIEHEAQDVIPVNDEEGDQNFYQLTTGPNDLGKVRSSLMRAGINILSSEYVYVPRTELTLPPKSLSAFKTLVSELYDKCDFITNIHHNVKEDEE